jgi:formate/nitrite transporter FocA (FNT family)
MTEEAKTNYAILTVMAVGLFCGIFIGAAFTGNVWRVEAIQKGHAKYVIINSLTGETQWMWNESAATKVEKK